jgi:outer membrane protein OmpA-like peptidoglycan-associated protein
MYFRVMKNKKLFLSLIMFSICFLAKAQEQTVVYFDTNKFDLNKIENKKLQTWIATNPNVKIVAINGYTDEVGTSGFNDTLAKKRVDFIFNQVKDKIKIRDDFKSRSFGENFQQSKNKAENRKVTIFYLLEKDIIREDEILGIKPKVVEPVIAIEEEIIPIEEESMNFPENATLAEKIALSKRGTLIRLNDINFQLNSFGILPSSKPAIDELIYIMANNENLKIEIQGHICCVNKDSRNLSTDRAKQVKRVLVFAGIFEKRIQTKGYGVSRPKFTIPEKSEYESARNRRVEIMILEK